MSDAGVDRGGAGNPGRAQPGQDLANPLRLGRAEELAHPKNEQSDDPGVTHPKRRSQDTARGCVEQANSDRPPLPRAPEANRRATRTAARTAAAGPGGGTRAAPRATGVA